MMVLKQTLIPTESIKRDKRIIEGIRLIDNELRYFKQKVPIESFMSVEDIQDMRSDCLLNMIKTVDRFDEDRKVKISTFLVPRIKGFFKDFLRQQNKFRLFKKTELANHIEADLDEIFKLRPEQIDKKLKDLGLGNTKIKEICLDIDNLDLTSNDHLLDSILELSDIRAYVVICYYLLDKEIKEIAEELGMSRTSGWIYKIKRQSIDLLKEKVESKLKGKET